MNNDVLGKMFSFVAVCIFILGAIGGTAYLFYDHHFLFGFTNIVICIAALPFFIDCFNDLIQ